MRFDEILYNDDVLDALDDMHFSECTPIQEKAIPAMESGRDVLALAQTGTGKTAAYLLPVIDRLADGGFPDDAVNCVVMAPTRELALQIDQQMQGFSYFLPQISSVAIYGGTDGKNYDIQKNALVKGADVVIATPGRLIAHLQMGYVDLSRVSFFILDEADRMLDMGFYEDIQKIMDYLPSDRQTAMFSATIPPKIKQLAAKILNDPIEIKIALSKPPESIDQQAYLVRDSRKEALLHHLLKSMADDRVIVFCSSKLSVKQLAKAIRSWHIDAAEIHSDLDQTRREDTMLGFRSGRIKVLVATDIVARGIDVDNIATIINYDVPHDVEDYVHRIGRTARASASGRAVTFVNEREREKFRRIERLIEKTVPKMPLPEELTEKVKEDDDKIKGGRSKKKEKRKTSKEAKEAKAENTKEAKAAKAERDTKDGKTGSDDIRPTRRRHHRRKKNVTPVPSENQVPKVENPPSSIKEGQDR